MLLSLVITCSIILPACSTNTNVDTSNDASTVEQTQTVEDKVEDYVSKMSLDEKICQLIIVRPETLTGDEAVTAADGKIKEALDTYPVGGFIYFDRNLNDAEQATTLIKDLQAFSKTPLFSCVDEEGGIVARCEHDLGTTKFENMYTYKDEGPEVATKNAKQIAEDISQFGFNLDFAPVADVWSNEENEVIAERAYSDNFEEACTLVSAAVEGFKEGKVMCTLKHFPGHGDTLEDTHEQLAFVNKTKEELLNNELTTFKAGINAGADMVMCAHIICKEIDDTLPVTLSSKVIPDLLRNELGYDGIVITDGLDMEAITDNYSMKEIVEGTLVDADVDILLLPNNIESCVEEIKASDRITEELITKKVKKIIALKMKNGLIE